MKRLLLHLMAAAEPVFSGAAWACIQAKAKLEDEQANQQEAKA